MTTYSLNIGWLYPDLMNTYGDSGNIACLKKRCEWRKIEFELAELNTGFKSEEIEKTDLIFMGGAQDFQQEIVSRDLKKKISTLKRKIENETVGLFICGAYQFLCNYYLAEDGRKIEGLGLLDAYTKSEGRNDRLIGDIAVSTSLPIGNNVLIGFENHGGRTFLGSNVKPLGNVLKGHGNNGIDQTEGAIYKNIFCSYMHGPLLPKNPDFADYLITLALEKKYKRKIKLDPIENEYEVKARKTIATKLQISL
jgi:lipid II isoglutaminyl synthase (glutamine-hydrolysing)